MLKALGIILLFLAYYPMFFLRAWEKHTGLKLPIFKDLLNESFSIFVAIGVGFILLSLKRKYLVPLYVLFFGIGCIYILDSVYPDDFFNTYYPVLIIGLSTFICSIIHLYTRRKPK